jgi:hypothetical protein
MVKKWLFQFFKILFLRYLSGLFNTYYIYNKIYIPYIFRLKNHELIKMLSDASLWKKALDRRTAQNRKSTWTLTTLP